MGDWTWLTLTTPHSCLEISIAKTEFLATGSADNTLRLWEVSTGKNLFTWEFPTAIKRVAWSEDDSEIVLVTEQRMGYQGAIRIMRVNRDDPTQRKPSHQAKIYYN